MCRRGCRRRAGMRPLHGGHAAPYSVLHLLEGTHLNLTDALARHTELVGELFERDRVIGEPPCLEDASLAIVEHQQRLTQRPTAVVELLALRQDALLAWCLIDQPVLPFAGVALLANGG